MSYIIGSFNLYKFSGQHDGEIAKNFQKLADIILSEKFDAVALQEVNTDFPLVHGLMPRLGKNWKMKWLSTEGSSHDHAEGYAFIWNDRRLHIVDDSEATIYKDYGVGKELVRPPMTIRLSPAGLWGGTFIELRLINIHIAFGRPAQSVLTDVDYRREELKILREKVFPRIEDKRYGNNMPAYTILMGDYNLCISGTPKIQARYSGSGTDYIDILSGSNKILRTVQAEKSSLKKASKSEQTCSRKDADKEVEESDVVDDEHGVAFYSQDYDHFTYNPVRFEDLGITVSRVDALFKYYGNDLSSYRREISDHVPIKIEIDFRNR